jgi:hypothetical protein
MVVTNALDDFYLSITLLVTGNNANLLRHKLTIQTVAYQLVFFAVAWTFKFDKVYRLSSFMVSLIGMLEPISLAERTLSFSRS